MAEVLTHTFVIFAALFMESCYHLGASSSHCYQISIPFPKYSESRQISFMKAAFPA